MEGDHLQNLDAGINEHEESNVLLEPVPSVALQEVADDTLPKVETQAKNSPSQDNNPIEKNFVPKSELTGDHDDDDADEMVTTFTPANPSIVSLFFVKEKELAPPAKDGGKLTTHTCRLQLKERKRDLRPDSQRVSWLDFRLRRQTTCFPLWNTGSNWRKTWA